MFSLINLLDPVSIMQKEKQNSKWKIKFFKCCKLIRIYSPLFALGMNICRNLWMKASLKRFETCNARLVSVASVFFHSWFTFCWSKIASWAFNKRSNTVMIAFSRSKYALNYVFRMILVVCFCSVLSRLIQWLKIFAFI